MAQDSIQITTTPPLPGITLVQQINAANLALATDFAGASDPGALAGPFMTWADTGTLTKKRRNAANTEWVIEGRLFREHMPIIPLAEVPTTDIGPIYIVGKGNAEWAVSKYEVLQPDGLQWLGTPIGGYITPYSPPPKNDPRYRYILCTAGHTGPGGYNEGVLINESVSGSGALIIANADISLAGSPMGGLNIPLINTDGRFIGASEAEILQNDMMQVITGTIAARGNSALDFTNTGAFSGSSTSDQKSWLGSGASLSRFDIRFDSSGSLGARTGDRTQPKKHGLPHYRRIM